MESDDTQLAPADVSVQHLQGRLYARDVEETCTQLGKAADLATSCDFSTATPGAPHVEPTALEREDGSRDSRLLKPFSARALLKRRGH